MADDAVLDETAFRKDILRLRATIERKIGGLVKDPAGRALRSIGEIYMTEAKRRTPVETGVLRASGHVEGPTKEGDSWKVRLVFGGPSAPYAIHVHENLHARHPVGQAKFLESVVLEHRNNFASEVAAMLVGGGRAYGNLFGSE